MVPFYHFLPGGAVPMKEAQKTNGLPSYLFFFLSSSFLFLFSLTPRRCFFLLFYFVFFIIVAKDEADSFNFWLHFSFPWASPHAPSFKNFIPKAIKDAMCTVYIELLHCMHSSTCLIFWKNSLRQGPFWAKRRNKLVKDISWWEFPTSVPWQRSRLVMQLFSFWNHL